MNAKEFCKEEKNALVKIKSLLSNGEASPFKNDLPLNEQLKNLLEEREYLYLHFPDGYALSLKPNFLKRVRAEVDFFLKILK